MAALGITEITSPIEYRVLELDGSAEWKRARRIIIDANERVNARLVTIPKVESQRTAAYIDRLRP